MPRGLESGRARAGAPAWSAGRCGRGRPGVSWYSSDSAQLMTSGPQRGTVTAMAPPGRSTRASSRMAAASSGMCSSTSEAITRSKVPSAKGSAQRVALHGRRRVARGDLPRLDHGGERAAHLGHLLGAGIEGHHRRRRGGPPRRRGGRTRSRGRARGPRARRRAGRSRRSASGRSSCQRRVQVAVRGRRRTRERLPCEDGLVAGRGPGRRHLPGEAAHHPLAAGCAEARPQLRVVEQAGDGAGQRARDRPAAPAGPSPRRCPRPRAARRRWWRPPPRRRTSPRSPAARTPRRARARPPPGPRRRDGPARRR